MSFDWNIILYVIFGLIPSLTWLFYYLRKDVHPEPNRMIVKIFLWGCLITVPVFFVQLAANALLQKFPLLPAPIESILYWFAIIAFSEELFKYIVVRFKVIGSPELDEPLDVMLYMVIAALGFTAVENVLYIFVPAGQLSFADIINRTLMLSFVRFVGATFLHTLCSAVVGYSLAIGLCKIKGRKIFTIAGLFLATLLHGLYDFSIIALEGNLKIIAPITILIVLAVLTSIGFEKLKELKSMCSLKSLWQTK